MVGVCGILFHMPTLRTVLIAAAAVLVPRALAAGQNLLANGSFALPDEGTRNCNAGGGAPTQPPSNWLLDLTGGFQDELTRNAPQFDPGCPAPPQTPDGYYASSLRQGGLRVRLYQTVTAGVTAGSPCQLDGYWAAQTVPPDNQLPFTVRAQLLDGPHTAAVLDETVVVLSSAGTDAFGWTPIAPVVGVPSANQITVRFEAVTDAGWSTLAVVHLDDITLTPAAACNDPFADAPIDPTALGPGDSFVNQSDFGLLQRCITGAGSMTIPDGSTEPALGYCICFDRDEDLDIDADDLAAFEACAAGAATPAPPSCDGGP